MILKISCDGGARGNPGPAASAFVANLSGKIVNEESKFLGVKTNNYAEYTSLIMALTWLLNYKKKDELKKAIIVMDSELVVNQMKGLYKVKSENIKPLAIKAKQLERKINIPLNYKSVLRNKNKRADRLVNKSIDENV